MQLLLNCFCKISGHDDQIMLVYVKSTSYISVILWNESLNSDGQQFHQYQQNEQPLLTSNHWTQGSY